MKKILLLLLVTSSAFAQTVCEQRAPLVQKDVFRWILSVTKEDKEYVSDTYFYGKKMGTLSDQELSYSLVGFYTDEFYGQINKALWSGARPSPITYLAGAIDQALCDFPAFDGEVYRGATLPEAVINSYMPASTITLKAFTSTSKKQKVGCDFAGNVIYKMRSRTGREIEAASLKKFEKEVLFHKNSTFTVKQVSTDRAVVRELSGCKKKGLTLIELEEL